MFIEERRQNEQQITELVWEKVRKNAKKKNQSTRRDGTTENSGN
jgi:hypothetical protein